LPSAHGRPTAVGDDLKVTLKLTTDSGDFEVRKQ
jgi:hypothetical protein